MLPAACIHIAEDGIELENESGRKGATEFTLIRNLHKIVDTISYFRDACLFQWTILGQESLLNDMTRRTHTFIRYLRRIMHTCVSVSLMLIDSIFLYFFSVQTENDVIKK